MYAVSGTNTVSFAIDFTGAVTKGLLGFSVERIDKKTGERKYADGFKVFKGDIIKPDEYTVVSTYTHPVQSFVWDDFTCYDDREYEYFFYPVKGTPEQLDRTAKPIILEIKTEAAFSKDEHDVFFNRGVASSQAYRRKFYNLPPDKITDPLLSVCVPTNRNMLSPLMPSLDARSQTASLQPLNTHHKKICRTLLVSLRRNE